MVGLGNGMALERAGSVAVILLHGQQAGAGAVDGRLQPRGGSHSGFGDGVCTAHGNPFPSWEYRAGRLARTRGRRTLPVLRALLQDELRHIVASGQRTCDNVSVRIGSRNGEVTMGEMESYVLPAGLLLVFTQQALMQQLVQGFSVVGAEACDRLHGTEHLSVEGVTISCLMC